MDAPLMRRWKALQHPRRGTRPPDAHARFEPGTPADYDLLARFHYLGGAPATVEAMLRAVDPASDEVIGVLVVSRPTLNGPWRARLWPRAYPARAAPAARAAWINRHLRTISRVVIDPRRRGEGIAAGLIRAYLARPLTGRTEAISSMGRVCPLFRAAGMREADIPESARDRELRSTLRALGVPAWSLCRPARPGPDAERALRRWARQSRATRHLADGPWEAVASRAAMALLARPLAYGWP